MPLIRYCDHPGCKQRIGLETHDGLCDVHAGRDIWDHVPTYDRALQEQLTRMRQQDEAVSAARIRYTCEHCGANMPENRKVPGERYCSDLCKSLHHRQEGRSRHA